MNTLEKQVSLGMKQQGISRGRLAAKVGYKNINKGLRRIDSFLQNPDQDSQLSNRLTQVLSISKYEFSCAIEDTKRSIEQGERLAFNPFIQVKLTKPPSPIFVAAMVPSLTRIETPESLVGLPYDKEIEAVCKLYQNHRDKFSPGWPAGNGFCYFRTYDEALSFDIHGRPLDSHQCKPYSIELRL